MGTPSYMAPEQARGDKIDHRVDIYSVGAILYHLTTGHRPFDGSDPTATITAVLTQEPSRPTSINPRIPEALEMIIQRAMAKSPSDRYNSMNELIEALTPFAATSRMESLSSIVITPPGFGSEGSAQTLLATDAQVAIERASRSVRLARPSLVLLGGAGAACGIFAAADALAALIRLVRGADITRTEAIMLVFGLIATAATPLGLMGRHIYKSIWNNSVRAVALAQTLKVSVVAGLAAYGVASLLVHFAEGVIRQDASDAAWAVWNLVFCAAATITVATVLILYKTDRSR
jgi:serine/threonine-protein kinase